jgi:alpha-glucosidase
VPTEANPSGFFQKPKYTLNQPENYEFARELRAVCTEHGERLLLGEVSGDRGTIRKFLGEGENDGLTLVFDFGMLGFRFSAPYFRSLIEDIERRFPDPFMPVYVFSNHDSTRSIAHLGNDVRKAKVLHLLQLTVRGVPCLYYGEELGMTNLRIPAGRALDPIARKFRAIPRPVFDLLGLTINRDEVRTPMQWSGGPNAGFSESGQTWLPLHPDYVSVNVEAENADPDSLLNVTRALLRIRNAEAALQEGHLEWIDALPPDVLGFERRAGSAAVAVFMSFSGSARQFRFPGGKCLMRLSNQDRLEAGTMTLSPFGGMIWSLPAP